MKELSDIEIRAIASLYDGYVRNNRIDYNPIQYPQGSEERKEAFRKAHENWKIVSKNACSYTRVNLQTQIEFFEEMKRISEIIPDELITIDGKKEMFNKAKELYENKLIKEVEYLKGR